MNKIIVTGGAGFIGSHLVDKLCILGHQVIVIDNFETGHLENLRNSKSKIEILRQSLSWGSVLLEKIPSLLNGTDYIYHLAALPRIERSIVDPIGTHDANVNGTLVVLELAKKLKVQKFFFISSSSIYGDQKVLPLTEDLNPNPQNPYAVHKLLGEEYAKLYANLYKISIITYRLFNVYGPRMFSKGSYKLVFTKWLEQINNKQPLTIFGLGDQTRDFTYVSDVVDGLIKGMKTEGIKYEVINLGYGRQIEVNYLAKLFKHPTQYLPQRPYEEKYKQADISKAKKILQWQPKVSIEEGVERLLADFSTTH